MLNSELQTFKSKVVSNDGTNGGRLSSTLVTSGVVQNVWPHVTKAERTSGSVKYRKIFDKVSNDDDESLINPGYYLDGDTLGEDWCIFAPTDQRSTQAEFNKEDGTDAPTRWYGAGELKEAITGGVTTTITVVMKDATIAGTIGLANDSIRISDKSTPDAVTGNEDLMTVNASAPSVSGAEVTFTFTAAVANSYSAGAKVSAIFEPTSDIACEVGTPSVTSASGTFDESFVILDNIGTTEQTVTLTFTGGTTFTAAMDDMSGLASGSTATDYIVTNPDFSKPVLTIESGAFGGTFLAGDEIEFTISPAAQPLVQRREVPAGCASLANNRIRKVTIGESVG